MVHLFIHRRDLRIHDNVTLSKQLSYIVSGGIEATFLPIFIFTPEQINEDKNQYYSNNLVQFMCESLKELYDEYQSFGIKMLFFYGDIIDVLKNISNNVDIESIGFNFDYSPYSIKRDDAIENFAKKNSIKIFNSEDMLLVNITHDATLSPNSGQPYKVYTPFYNRVVKIPVEKVNNKHISWLKKVGDFEKKNLKNNSNNIEKKLLRDEIKKIMKSKKYKDFVLEKSNGRFYLVCTEVCSHL